MENEMESKIDIAEIARRGVAAANRWAEAKTDELRGPHNEYLGDYDEPPCFGGVYQVGDGDLVSEARMNQVFATAAERDFWMCCMNFAGDNEAMREVTAAAFGCDDAKLAELASESVNDAAAPCFYTEIDKDDFTPEELGALFRSRPELFVVDTPNVSGEAVAEEPTCGRETGGDER